MNIIHTFLLALIMHYGIFAVGAFILLETGLFLGLILPGDTILIFAGVYAAKGFMPLFQLIILTIIAAIFGNLAGYYLGKRLGTSFFNKTDSLLFNKKHITEAHVFFDKYGALAIFLARFLGYIRPLVPIVAGIGNMEFKQFLNYTILSAIVWVTGFTLLGYFLGIKSKYAMQIVNYLIIGVILISISLVVGAAIQRFYVNKKVV